MKLADAMIAEAGPLSTRTEVCPPCCYQPDRTYECNGSTHPHHGKPSPGSGRCSIDTQVHENAHGLDTIPVATAAVPDGEGEVSGVAHS